MESITANTTMIAMMMMIMQVDELDLIFHLPGSVKTNHNYKFRTLFFGSSLLDLWSHCFIVTISRHVMPDHKHD